MVMCARLGREATEIECCEVIVTTARRRDLTPCRACPRGLARAATAPIRSRGNQPAAAPARRAAAPAGRISRDRTPPPRPAAPRPGTGHAAPPVPAGPLDCETLTSKPRPAMTKRHATSRRPAIQGRPATARRIEDESPLLPALIGALAYDLPRYKGQADLGLKFLALLVRDRSGLSCAWTDLEQLCRAQGLNLKRRKGSAFVALDDQARELAGRTR